MSNMTNFVEVALVDFAKKLIGWIFITSLLCAGETDIIDAVVTFLSGVWK